MTGVATAAAVTVGMVSLAPTAQGQDNPEPAGYTNAHVHRDAGKPLFAKSNETPAARVKAYLESHGHSDLTVGSLAAGGSWKSHGVGHLLMEQRVAGLRVNGTYAKAAFDSSGRLIDLIENVAAVPKGAPAAASIDEAEAFRTAVAKLYPRRSIDTRSTGHSQNTTQFAKGSQWHAEPTVERVALPTTDGGLEVGYVVTTWDAKDNDLYETTVSGDGHIVETLNRTAEDGYNVFQEDPDKSRQKKVSGPGSGNDVSPIGWLSGAQFSRDISGNNAHAYLDADADNGPDAPGTPVTNSVFGSVDDLTAQPDTGKNPDVAVQNLFYLNNVIHDTLYRAGFDEAAGNFQQDNFRKGGRGADPVAAEAQDGSGTDNANFATPTDGQDPRMQMYLWNAPITHQVVVGSSTYAATGASWGKQLDGTGMTGLLAVADDGTGTTTDACESFPAGTDYTGKLVIADRGTCAFTVKAKNAQIAGATGVIIANNVSGAPVQMGGDDSTVSIPGVMVSKSDGTTLKGKAGASATIRLISPKPLMRDGDVDSDIVWHEYGHGLTWRMIGRMDGPIAGAIGEGMSDVLSLIANEDDVVGEYSSQDPTGIRRYPYDGYPLTYKDMNSGEVHADGELYGAIGWLLLQEYKSAHINKSVLLSDLVDGMNYTPAQPTYEEMRDGILAGLTASGNGSRSCMVWDAFSHFGVGAGAKATVRGSSVAINESFAKPSGC